MCHSHNPYKHYMAHNFTEGQLSRHMRYAVHKKSARFLSFILYFPSVRLQFVEGFLQTITKCERTKHVEVLSGELWHLYQTSERKASASSCKQL